jgi:hypothetical protein
VDEAVKTHARATAPDHGYYAQMKDRKNGKRAALSEARKIVRQACHILAELGDEALAACPPFASDGDPAPRHAGPGQARRSHDHPMGTTAASSRKRPVSHCRPCRPGPRGRPG